MIKGIAYQKVNITELEYKCYEEIVKEHSTDEVNGSKYFEGLFETDDNGKILIINPTKNIPWSVLFFIQNLMINQWLRSYDKRIKNIENQNRRLK